MKQDPLELERRFAQMATADGLWQLIINMSSERDRGLYESELFSITYPHRSYLCSFLPVAKR
ncbi:MAG: hypothetical protein KME12_25930 [Trichocoleus desertorum ATA4-8-CV12]|jgi:hypothetical protein|nr:hypothetical protein [Trichocoleus desertorum ATA4-8-CV12]